MALALQAGGRFHFKGAGNLEERVRRQGKKRPKFKCCADFRYFNIGQKLRGHLELLLALMERESREKITKQGGVEVAEKSFNCKLGKREGTPSERHKGVKGYLTIGGGRGKKGRTCLPCWNQKFVSSGRKNVLNC